MTRQEFERLLWDLCSEQDNVTHLNELGSDYAAATVGAQAERRVALDRVLAAWDTVTLQRDRLGDQVARALALLQRED